MKTGVFNPSNPLETQGITPKTAHYNLTEAALMQASLTAGESTLSKHGALLVNTGQYTGRSPQDKFIVREAATEPHIWWEN
ncbi:MAG: phosphoenolpyruvate carboxykinase (ATP), partial [Proteobacteria bacterium]|nr:phosphoenolpyruvate carboxykinase (ATP) [Pseudomonadota bacterium]